MKRGAHEISRVKAHVLKVLDAMVPSITTRIVSEREILTRPDADFIFGGYNWRRKVFQMWNIRYGTDKHFQAHPGKYWAYFPIEKRLSKKVTKPDPKRTDSFLIGPIAFAGDQAAKATELLEKKMLEKFNRRRKEYAFNMEPFEVVRDMLRDCSHSPTIGGPPQVVKVFQYLRTASFAVYWPNKAKGMPFLHGRPILEYESLDKHVIDPDTLEEEVIIPTSRIDPLGKDRSSSEL